MASVIDDLDKPNLTLKELWEFLYYDEELPVTYRQLRNAVIAEELERSQFSNKNYFSKRDGLDWVAAQKGRKRMSPKSAATQ
ncbi:hypothetical protein [Mycobacterium sp. D16R24]|uniref:hypothetical protein n=1 Tax=Mycobacterium sp. D16R24 TaxID=1855656 RepID=UPI000993E152|nr:hypothetical protein [Mycobacterium sp. D16R24]